MKPTLDPISPDAPHPAFSPLALAVRTAFLEGFAQEIARDTGIAGAAVEDPESGGDLSEGGYRPVNSMAGLR